MKTSHDALYRLFCKTSQIARRFHCLVWSRVLIKTYGIYAKAHDYIIVTKDADFLDMSLLFGQPPKIIWLKIGNQTKAATIKALLDNRVEIEQMVITEDKACVEIY